MIVVRRPLAYRPAALVWLVVVAAPALVRAQYQKYEGQPVTMIQFEPPESQPLTATELHDLLPLKMNQPMRMADVRASIERLFATGRYADIQVDARPYRNGVAVTFVTKNSWFIGGISVRGALPSPPNRGQLASASQLNLGEPYTEAKLNLGLANQRRLLENNGFFRSAIVPVFDWTTGREYQQVNIRFDVNSGPRAHYTTPVVSGDVKMAIERIIKATKFQRWLIHTWKPVTQVRTRQGLEGVRSLYQKDNRLEAKISLESMKYEPEANTALPTLAIDAGPRIRVNAIGASISDRKLRRYVPIFEEHDVDRDLLVEGARNIRDYLQNQGYFDAEVEFKQQRVINDQANIDYLIATGARHKLVSIEITGNRYFNTESIRERMFLRTASLLQFRYGRYSASLMARDLDSIASLYQSNGFRDVKVDGKPIDDFRGVKGDLGVVITIQEGPQYFVDTLQVRGVERLKREDIESKLSSVAGQPFSEFNVAVDRDTILAQYSENGFPDARFEWSFKPSPRPHRVDLSYIITEGRQQSVREVIVTGNHVTRTTLINHNLLLNPGDPLSPSAITATQRRLYDLGVFARVDAAIQDPQGDTSAKYVLYNLEEARRFSTAVGFGAELGRIGGCSNCFQDPAGTTGFSPRASFDITRSNLWGVAHSISLRTRASTLDQRALLNYSWPRFEGRDNLTVSFTGLWERSRDVRTFSLQRLEGSTQLTQRYSKATTFFYRITYRKVKVSDLKVSPFILGQLTQPVRVGISSMSMIDDRRDDPVEPHKGTYNTLELGIAGKYLGSQVSFLRFLGRNASYYRVGKRLVLARSTQFGEMFPFRYTGDLLEAIPLAERFFGGGGISHRGFPEQQAGPRDPTTGFPLGGTALLFNQTELRFPLFGENLGGVLYHDMGNIYSTLGNLSFRVRQRDEKDFDYMVHGVGFGIRYRTPVGPVRVDLGASLNPPRFFGVRSNATQQDLINAGLNPCNTPNLCVNQSVGHFRYFISIGQTF